MGMGPYIFALTNFALCLVLSNLLKSRTFVGKYERALVLITKILFVLAAVSGVLVLILAVLSHFK